MGIFAYALGGIYIPYRRKPKAPTYLNENIICCKYYFIVERRIVSLSLPNRAGLSLDAFKKYLLLCRREAFGNGSTISGWEDTSKRISISLARKKEPNIIKELADKYFIEILDAQKWQYRILVAPLYDGTIYIKNPDQSRKWQDLKRGGNGFILVPREIVDVGFLSVLSGRQLQVLLQLYLFNKLDIYGGIDPNVIHFPVRVEIRGYRDIVTLGEIDESLYMDIYLTKAELVTTLASLLKIGIIKPSKIIVIKDETRMHYVCDYSSSREMKQGERVIQVLRPVYQLESQVEKWNECNKEDCS